MADFNLNSPTLLGMELRPREASKHRLDSPLRAQAMRFKGQAATISHVHLYLDEVVGRNPGLAVEIVDTLLPALTTTAYYPGTDTGATTTGWEDQANGAANFSEIDDQTDTTDYQRNAAALAATGSLKSKWRGSATFDTTQRVVKVALKARVQLSTSLSNGASVLVRGVLDISGTEWFGAGTRVARDGRWQTIPLGEWALNPSTDQPWTAAQVAAFLTSATDEFGVQVIGQVVAEGFRVAGLWLEVTTCVENRLGSYYQVGTPPVGWNELALSSTSALVEGGYYWLVVSALAGSAANYVTVRTLTMSDVLEATSSAATSGEHRRGAQVALAAQGGAGQTAEEFQGRLLAALLDASTTIQTQSQPYAELASVGLSGLSGGVDLPGASGDYVSTPDNAKFDILGDLDVRVRAAPDDWTPAAVQTLIAKWVTTGNQRSYMLQILAAGTLRFSWSNNGTTVNTATSTAAPTISDGQALWARATIDVDNGAAGRDVKFYTSVDYNPATGAGTWTQLGATVTSATATAIFNSTAAVELGSNDGGTVERFAGIIYDAEIRNLIGGQVRGAPTFTGQPITATTVRDLQGATWTLNGNADLIPIKIGQQLTTAAGTTYAGLRLAAAWVQALAPDRPLLVEVRSGTAGASGGGALAATARLDPSVTTQKLGDYYLKFDAAFVASGATQYYLVIYTAAASNRAWSVPVLDTRSDRIGTGTTVAEIEGASQGGQTDSYTNRGVLLDRYDLAAMLVAVPTAPAGLTATARAAA